MAASARTGTGVAPLWEEIQKVSSSVIGMDGPLPTATQNARLGSVLAELEILKTELEEGLPAEFLSERNRRLIDRLSTVMGDVSNEDVLGRIFTDFCIGK